MFEDKNQLNQPLGTNTQSVNTQEILGQAKAKDIDVHVMPGKFLPQLPKKQVGAKQKISLMVILLVLFLVALIGGGIWFIMNQQNSILSANNSNEVATNTNTNENVNANENTNTNTNENVNANENTNSNINSNTNTSGTEVSALDNDSDGLTHEEEIVFGTGVDDEDTDNDGFSDGQEVANLYNPLVPRQALADSSLVSKYTNVSFDYSLLIPSSWLARELKTDGSQVAILPDSEVGDSILIETNTNADRLSLEQWKNQLYPQVIFENYTLDGQPALLSQNGVLVLLVTNERVYTIRYRISDTESTYYPTIFEMMIKSFSLEKTPNTIIDGQ